MRVPGGEPREIDRNAGTRKRLRSPDGPPESLSDDWTLEWTTQVESETEALAKVAFPMLRRAMRFSR